MVPEQLILGDALLLGGDDVAGEHREHGTVHGQRHRHLLERDPVEEDLHVLDRVDGDARHADVADDAWVVAVVAAVGREVERDRHAGLPRREVRPIEGVRLLRGGEAGVLADRPRAVRVHRRPHASQERAEPRKRVDRLEPLEVLRGVERTHRDALGGLPDQAVGVVPLELLAGQCPPRLEVGPALFSCCHTTNGRRSRSAIPAPKTQPLCDGGRRARLLGRAGTRRDVSGHRGRCS